MRIVIGLLLAATITLGGCATIQSNPYYQSAKKKWDSLDIQLPKPEERPKWEKDALGLN